jgi:hypothetical protein
VSSEIHGRNGNDEESRRNAHDGGAIVTDVRRRGCELRASTRPRTCFDAYFLSFPIPAVVVSSHAPGCVVRIRGVNSPLSPAPREFRDTSDRMRPLTRRPATRGGAPDGATLLDSTSESSAREASLACARLSVTRGEAHPRNRGFAGGRRPRSQKKGAVVNL